MSRLARGCCLAVLLLQGCAETPRTCKAHVVADLKLLPDTGIPVVEATVDGHPVALGIDTGAQTSVLSQRAADRFHIYPGMNGRMAQIMGIGGMMLVPVATVHHLGLGHGIARDVSMPVVGDLGEVRGLTVLGLFGADFLSNYDVDVDVPARHFSMYALRDCDNVPPFDAPYFQVPFHVEDTAILVGIKLDGVPLEVQLDTGATTTAITRDDARRAGVVRTMLLSDAQGRAVGIDETPVEARRHQFGKLSIGEEELTGFAFAVSPMQTGRSLLGNDFLKYNRVWISYPQQKLTIQPDLASSHVHQDPGSAVPGLNPPVAASAGALK